jgi:hypothetical protein
LAIVRRLDREPNQTISELSPFNYGAGTMLYHDGMCLFNKPSQSLPRPKVEYRLLKADAQCLYWLLDRRVISSVLAKKSEWTEGGSIPWNTAVDVEDTQQSTCQQQD